MPKLTKDQKQKFFELYKQGCRLSVIARIMGMSCGSVARIIYEFNAGKFSWLDSGFRNHYDEISESEKVRIVNELSTSCMSWGEAVSLYGFSEQTLRHWIRNYNKYGVCSLRRGKPTKDGVNNNERHNKTQATRKGEEITARRDYYLQNILPSMRGERDRSSKKKTLRAISECRKLGIPLKRCLEVLDLSPSTYHFWKKHEKDEKDKDKKLTQAIRCAQEHNHWAYGSKRMAKWLVNEGFAEKLNHKRVDRVMSKFDLHARIRRKHHSKNYYISLKDNPAELPQNILARDFKATGPMQKLVTDITYLPTNEGWIYMAAVMDLWNREIVSYKISGNPNLELVKDVVSQLGFCKGALIHSDMGLTYTNASYIGYLKKLGLKQSLSRRGNCWDNACMENFFGLMKSETFKQSKEILSVDQMTRLINDYIHWYNKQRIQKKLGYLSPIDFRKLAT